jgi:protein involved in polysaccharide export with SLBB domain
LQDKDHKDNILLQEYDIVRVLSVDDFDDKFTVAVLGAVRSPGIFEFGVGMSLQDVLLQAGALTQQAEGSRIEVSRIMDYDISSNKLKPRRALVKTIKIGESLILSAEAQEFNLQPFDQIFVRENPDFEPARNIYISGEVKYSGVYTLLRKDEKILSVIKRAGGLTSYAYKDGAQMFRRFNVPQTPIIESTSSKEISGISDELTEAILNDPYMARLYTEDIISTNDDDDDDDDIFGEINKDYSYDAVYLDMKKALKSSASKHNIVLHDGDSIIIPKTMDVVHITGELINLEGNSISAPYFNRKRANYYINNFAGGFSKENKKNNTVVVYPNGIAKKTTNFGLFSLSPKVKKGATIKVVNKVEIEKKKKIPFDWNKAIESTMLKMTAVLTLWLLFDKVAPQQ